MEGMWLCEEEKARRGKQREKTGKAGEETGEKHKEERKE